MPYPTTSHILSSFTVPESAMDPSHSFTKLRAAASSFSSKRSVERDREGGRDEGRELKK
jgi:hypothetical protein